MSSVEDEIASAHAAKRPDLAGIAALLERHNIALEDVGKVKQFGITETDRLHKDDMGANTVTTLVRSNIVISPKWEEGPEWPVVQPATPVTIKPLPRPKSAPAVKTWVILPDPQIGYRRFEDGTMDPFHDEDAIAAALTLVRALRPQGIVNLGDTLDFPEWSQKFAVSPEFVQTTQPTLNRAQTYLADQRANSTDDTEILLFEGNHDARLAQFIMRNAKSALRLKVANAPDSWPVLSVPNLLALDTLGVTYVEGWPAGRAKIADGNLSQPPLYAVHGERLDVVKVARGERQSYVQGHIHRISEHNETYEIDGIPVTVTGWSPGCLSRIDGAVPSTKGGEDARGRPVRRWENWQQGVGVVSVFPDGSWAKEIAPIRNGRCFFRGEVYQG